MVTSGLREVQAVYAELIHNWNNRNALGMANLYMDDAENISYEGIHVSGKDAILAYMNSIFEENLTPLFVTKIKNIDFLSDTVVMIHAIAGMVPPGQSDILPERNTHHTCILMRDKGKWRIKSLQSTPVGSNDSPEILDQITVELREQLNESEEN